jgi:short-subunit dehydrogenase
VKVLPLDLAELSNLPSKAEEALNMFGRIDVLVNNGGVSTRSLAQNSSSQMDVFVAKVDYLSHVSLTKSLLPSWLEPGKSTFNPVIINTSSVAGKLGAPVRTSYCGAKHALQGWFDAFRLELQLLSQPVHILNIVLGSTRTNVARNAIVETVENTFGSNDANIESGLEPEFVVKKVLAAAWAGRQEIWIAPRVEMMMLYLNQHVPEMAKKIMLKYIARQYAVQK